MKTDYTYLESLLKDEEKDIKDIENDSFEEDILEKISIERLIKDHLIEEEELNKEFLRNKSLKSDIDSQFDDRIFKDFDYDDSIEEKYYELFDYDDELYYKSLESRKRNKDEEDSFNDVTDYGDYPYDN